MEQESVRLYEEAQGNWRRALRHPPADFKQILGIVGGNMLYGVLTFVQSYLMMAFIARFLNNTGTLWKLLGDASLGVYLLHEVVVVPASWSFLNIMWRVGWGATGEHVKWGSSDADDGDAAVDSPRGSSALELSASSGSKDYWDSPDSDYDVQRFRDLFYFQSCTTKAVHSTEGTHLRAEYRLDYEEGSGFVGPFNRAPHSILFMHAYSWYVIIVVQLVLWPTIMILKKIPGVGSVI